MSLPNAPTPTGRDAQGRFAAGNPGGPGNPYTRQTALLRQAVLETMNETEIRLITQKMLTLALQGDMQAIKLTLAYAIGKLDQAINPDELDRLEWDLRNRLTVPIEAVEALTERVPVRQANAVAEATEQPVAIQVGQEIVRRLQERGILPGDRRAPSLPSTPPSGKEKPGKPAVAPHTTGATRPQPEARNGHSGAAGERR